MGLTPVRVTHPVLPTAKDLVEGLYRICRISWQECQDIKDAIDRDRKESLQSGAAAYRDRGSGRG